MSTPSIKVGQGNWGIKAGNLLGYANTEKKFSPVEFTSSRALDTATRVNASGNIEIVNANIPRIDYFGGQASLLVEPSVTNSMLYSQAINSWTKGGLTITDNFAISPDGTQNASYIQQTTGGSIVNLQSAGVSIASGQLQSVTFFAKAAQITSLTLRFGTSSLWGPSGTRPQFTLNLTNGAVTLDFGSATLSSQNFGNGWYRYSIVTSATLASGTTTIQTVTNTVFSPNSGDGFYLWGVQWEQNAFAPTSYIPTTTGTVARSADVVSVTGVSSLLGQTSGTFYTDISYELRGPSTSNRWFEISSATNNIGLAVHGINAVRSIVNAQSDLLSSPPFTYNGIKIAWGYDGNGVSFFMNGVKYSLASGGSQVITSLDKVLIDMGSASGSRIASVRIRAISCYQTRLPDTTTDGSPSLQSITTL
jgi:hypothetical protein